MFICSEACTNLLVLTEITLNDLVTLNHKTVSAGNKFGPSLGPTACIEVIFACVKG